MEAITLFAAAQSQRAHVYALVDPAQDRALPAALQFASARAVCLLDVRQTCLQSLHI